MSISPIQSNIPEVTSKKKNLLSKIISQKHLDHACSMPDLGNPVLLHPPLGLVSGLCATVRVFPSPAPLGRAGKF